MEIFTPGSVLQSVQSTPILTVWYHCYSVEQDWNSESTCVFLAPATSNQPPRPDDVVCASPLFLPLPPRLQRLIPLLMTSLILNQKFYFISFKIFHGFHCLQDKAFTCYTQFFCLCGSNWPFSLIHYEPFPSRLHFSLAELLAFASLLLYRLILLSRVAASPPPHLWGITIPCLWPHNYLSWFSLC